MWLDGFQCESHYRLETKSYNISLAKREKREKPGESLCIESTDYYLTQTTDKRMGKMMEQYFLSEVGSVFNCGIIW